MPPIVPTERSRQPIDVRDLERLAEFAAADLADYARRSETGALYEERVLCVALCQGAALHFIDATTGIKDFDVWTFFAEVPGRPFPARRLVARDFGASRFGRSPSRRRLFVGRRVDLLGRSLPATPEDDPVQSVQDYLSARRTVTARKLAEKGVVVLAPARLRGEVIWPRT